MLEVALSITYFDYLIEIKSIHPLSICQDPHKFFSKKKESNVMHCNVLQFELMKLSRVSVLDRKERKIKINELQLETVTR